MVFLFYALLAVACASIHLTLLQYGDFWSGNLVSLKFWSAEDPWAYAVKNHLSSVGIYRTFVYMIPSWLYKALPIHMKGAMTASHWLSYFLAFWAIDRATYNLFHFLNRAELASQLHRSIIVSCLAVLAMLGTAPLTQMGDGWALFLAALTMASAFSQHHPMLKFGLCLLLVAFNKETPYLFVPLIFALRWPRQTWTQRGAMVLAVSVSVGLYLAIRTYYPVPKGTLNFALENFYMSLGFLVNTEHMIFHKSVMWIYAMLPATLLFFAGKWDRPLQFLFLGGLPPLLVNLVFGNTDEFRIFPDTLMIFVWFTALAAAEWPAQRPLNLWQRGFTAAKASATIFALAATAAIVGAWLHGPYFHLSAGNAHHLKGHFAHYYQFHATLNDPAQDWQIAAEGFSKGLYRGLPKSIFVRLKQGDHQITKEIPGHALADKHSLDTSSFKPGPITVELTSWQASTLYIQRGAPSRDVLSAHFEIFSPGATLQNTRPKQWPLAQRLPRWAQWAL